MGRVAYGVVGAVVGGVYGYYTGDYSQVLTGWTIGYGIGGLVESKPGFEGPKLSDLRFTSSSYGQPIPWIRGAARVSGQIVWASDKMEVATTTEQGKGGGQESTAYTYEMNVLVMLCDHEAVGVTRIWSNGKLVWNSLISASTGTLVASVETDLWGALTFYPGGPAQLPDPTYEAGVGVGNATAYRGRSTLMIERLQLGSSGQLPNLTFELMRTGSAAGYNTALLNAPLTANSADLAPTPASAATTNPLQFAFGPAGVTITAQLSIISSIIWTGAKLDLGLYSGQKKTLHCVATFPTVIGTGTGNNQVFMTYATLGVSFSFGVRMESGVLKLYTARIGGATLVINHGTFTATSFDIVFGADNLTVQWVADGIVIRTDSVGVSGGSVSIAAQDHVNNGVLTFLIKDVQMYLGDDLFTTTVFTPAPETVQSVVEALCARAGLPVGAYDASGLSTSPRAVRGMAVSVGPTRGALEQLSTAFFFNCSLRDKLRFTLRGSAPVRTIPWEDLAAKPEQSDEVSLALTVMNDLELPPQAAVSYININDDGQVGTEYSDRMTGGQAAIQTVTLGIGMIPSEAKNIADTVVSDSAAALVSGEISLPIKYAALDPTDVVFIADRDGRVYRMRLTRKRDESGVLSFDTVGDDSKVIESQSITDGTQVPGGNVTKPGDTVFIPLDIPLLRDEDDAPGYYVSAKGSTANWPGGQIRSSPDNVTFTNAATVTESAVFGTCTTTLGNYTAGGFDEASSVTVNVGSGTLASSTRDAILADETINAMLIGDEAIRFRTAALVTPGIYTLTGLLRGQAGTDWATATHGASERAVLLRAAGTRRVSQQASENGALRYLRAGTIGSSVLPATTQFTNANRGLKPLSPQVVRGTAQENQDVLLTWLRRSRLSAKFLPPTGVPLDEATESYVVRVYTLPSTLKRTYIVNAPSATYTRAQQIADGITAGTALRIDVSQVSAIVGEGYVGTGTAFGASSANSLIYRVLLAGTFQSGTVLRVVAGSSTVDYTVTVGDANMLGAATSLAAAIDALPDYTAAVVPDAFSSTSIAVAGPPGIVYSLVPSVPTGDNYFLVVGAQSAAPPSEGTSYAAYISIGNLITGATIPIQIGTSFTVSIQLPIGNTIGSFSFTTSTFIGNLQQHSHVHDGLGAACSLSTLAALGYSYGTTFLTDYPTGYLIGPSGVVGIQFTSSATPPFNLFASVTNPGSGPIPAGQPQITHAQLYGTTAVVGAVYSLTLSIPAPIVFSYTAVPGDTTQTVANSLSALVDADANYVSSVIGGGPLPWVVVVQQATNNVHFNCVAKIAVSTMSFENTQVIQYAS